MATLRKESLRRRGTSRQPLQSAKLDLGPIISQDRATLQLQVSIKCKKSLDRTLRASASVNQSRIGKLSITGTITGQTSKNSPKRGISHPLRQLVKLELGQNPSRSKVIRLVLVNIKLLKKLNICLEKETFKANTFPLLLVF